MQHFFCLLLWSWLQEEVDNTHGREDVFDFLFVHRCAKYLNTEVFSILAV